MKKEKKEAADGDSLLPAENLAGWHSSGEEPSPSPTSRSRWRRGAPLALSVAGRRRCSSECVMQSCPPTGKLLRRSTESDLFVGTFFQNVAAAVDTFRRTLPPTIKSNNSSGSRWEARQPVCFSNPVALGFGV